MNYYCSSCQNSFKNIDLMCVVKGKVRNKCKNCHKEAEKARRSRWTADKKSDSLRESRENYYKRRKKYLELDENNPEDFKEIVRLWVLKTCSRNSENKFKDRRNLDKDNLHRLCVEARKTFPYITFKNVEGCLNPSVASLDRVDSNIGYEDNNIIVIPMWLNSAKMNGTFEELFRYIEQLNQKDFLESL